MRHEGAAAAPAREVLQQGLLARGVHAAVGRAEVAVGLDHPPQLRLVLVVEVGRHACVHPLPVAQRAVAAGAVRCGAVQLPGLQRAPVGGGALKVERKLRRRGEAVAHDDETAPAPLLDVRLVVGQDGHEAVLLPLGDLLHYVAGVGAVA
eukprot:scaffold47512_cov68-Phaeocystis_antarctica.AAC.2